MKKLIFVYLLVLSMSHFTTVYAKTEISIFEFGRGGARGDWEAFEEMQATIARQADTIGQLRSAADNAAQTSTLMGYVNSVLTPIAAKVNEIAAKQLPTVNVQWPQLQAINTTPYVSGGIYGAYGYGYGNNGLVF